MKQKAAAVQRNSSKLSVIRIPHLLFRCECKVEPLRLLGAGIGAGHLVAGGRLAEAAAGAELPEGGESHQAPAHLAAHYAYKQYCGIRSVGSWYSTCVSVSTVHFALPPPLPPTSANYQIFRGGLITLISKHTSRAELN